MKNDPAIQNLLDKWAADRPARRNEADRLAFQLDRPTIRRPAPQITLTNDRTKQATLFDAGGNDLPGQMHLFDDITQD